MFVDKKGRKCYKLGLHIHTTVSDGALSPSETAKRYRDAGYDAIAFTDHWKYHDSGELEGITILSGCEYNLGENDKNNVMHIVGIGMERDPEIKDNSSRQEVIDGINSVGGIAILAHPYWSLNSVEDATALHGLTATEIYNTVSDVHESFRPYSGYFVDLLANAGRELLLFATDDSHFYDGDECRSYIIVRAENGSREALLDAIRRGDFYATQGPEINVDRCGQKIVLDCSPADEVFFVSNAAWTPDRAFREGGYTHVEYTLKGSDQWVRLEVKSGNNTAWSNIIRIK